MGHVLTCSHVHGQSFLLCLIELSSFLNLTAEDFADSFHASQKNINISWSELLEIETESHKDDVHGGNREHLESGEFRGAVSVLRQT